MPKQKKTGRVLRGRPGPKRTPGGEPDARLEVVEESILDMISRISQEVPESDWARLPTDLSKNVDHYLYGTKKKEK